MKISDYEMNPNYTVYVSGYGSFGGGFGNGSDGYYYTWVFCTTMWGVYDINLIILQ
jgi:hypothetical protein